KLGISPNVHLRQASGPNDLENFPDLTSAVTANGTTTVRGTIDGAPRTSYQVQFFSSPSADASGYGEGQIYLGETSVTTGADGLATRDDDAPGPYQSTPRRNLGAVGRGPCCDPDESRSSGP